MATKFDSAKKMGLLFAILTALVLCYMLFSSPRIGGVDYGNYDLVLTNAGLLRTEQDLTNDADRYYTHVAEQFDYGRFSYSTMLAPGTPTLTMFIAAVRFVTSPFGLQFSTAIMSVLYIIIISLSVMCLVTCVGRYWGSNAAWLGAALVMMFTRSELTGYLNSLYTQGATITCALAYLALVVRAFASKRFSGLSAILPPILMGGLLLLTDEQMLIFVPLILIITAIMLYYHMPVFSRRLSYLVVSLCVVAYSLGSFGVFFLNSPKINSDATRYLAVFQGLLPSSPDAAGDLKALGLDESYQQDIGRSYYDAKESFAHDPQGEDQPILFEHIRADAVAKLYLTHPDRLLSSINAQVHHLNSALNGRIKTVDNAFNVENTARLSPILIMDLFIPLRGFWPQTGWMLLSAALAFLLAVIGRRLRDGRSFALITLGLTMLTCALYLPATVFFTGGADIETAKILFMFFAQMGMLLSLVMFVMLIDGAIRFVQRERFPLLEPAFHMRDGRWQNALQKWMDYPNAAAITAFTLAMGMGLYLLLVNPHAGGINNGDYGRMMKALGIMFRQDIIYDYAAQSGRTVIEQYDLIDFVNPLTAGYSLAYPAFLIRMGAILTNSPFSTWALSMLLVIMTVLSLVSIIKDLSPILKKFVFIPAILLPLMLMSENYIAWYNSLFGEGTISTGLIMTIAAGVHLAVMPREKHSLLWLALLAFSGLILCSAKAQMLLALPGVLILFAVMIVRHFPKKLLKRILYTSACAVMVGSVVLSSVMLYVNNEGDSSKNTVWHSVFFGALMVSDDPIADMVELGIDTRMAPDIGKHSYYPDEDYVIAPFSEEAQAAFFDHVNTFTMVRYYLKHPIYLMKMLDYAAGESVQLHTGFMGYNDERYDLEHTEVSRFSLWRSIRPIFAGHAFWQYVLVYAIFLFVLIRRMADRSLAPHKRLLPVVMLCIMAVGVLQYPLTVVGNGFADNNKQLYCFMLCHDWMIIFGLTELIRLASKRWRRYVAVKEVPA